MMVEGEMNEVSEHDMLEAIKFAHEEIKKHCRVQKELMHELGTDVNKRDYPHDEEDEALRTAVREFCYDKCYKLAKSAAPKHEREAGFEAIQAEFLATLSEEDQEAKAAMVARYYHDVEKEAMRNMILDEGCRLDGRKTDEVRPIWCEVDYLPCAHGSAIFTRGETQSLASVTLGTKLDMKEMDEVLIQDDQQFVLHTTTSRRSPPVRPSLSAAWAVARSATATWRCAPSSPSSPPLRNSRTPCASFPISSSPTAPPPWLPSAAAAWP